MHTAIKNPKSEIKIILLRAAVRSAACLGLDNSGESASPPH
jgi:hypothetical protein